MEPAGHGHDAHMKPRSIRPAVGADQLTDAARSTDKLGRRLFDGGGGSIGVSADARITATFLFAALGINNTKNIKAPWAGTFAENDEFFAWSTIKPATLASPQPAFAGMITGTTHNNLPGNAKSSEAYIGFLRWRFMGDPGPKQCSWGPPANLYRHRVGESWKTPTWDRFRTIRLSRRQGRVCRQGLDRGPSRKIASTPAFGES